ncbi:FtsH protease activity modulator HflK [Pleionea litopenaei]|uniref:Protein HflK n=1 Tax=Pleionea litopenaei TaxID=3070815 RepID=A0AA51RWB9_9GAMM|nr:FtsH protease activity modulator HflK [Pleionea sp. HL-JVS1]WMS88986.1 FtsH protease activity modulator HflK [Pleionea sp. HL-JVS1]
MTWNSPGGNNKDPWGNRNKQNGPPDMDEAIKNLWKKISGGNGNGGNQKPASMKPFVFIGLVVGFVFWVIAGIHTVNEQERGVVLTFGKFRDIVGPGINWVPYGISTLTKVNVNKVDQKRVDGSMLTKDLNIIDVEIGIQYRIDDPKDFLFNLSTPDFTLVQAAESALRQVVGDSQVDDLLTTEKTRIRNELSVELIRILDSYQTGLKIEQVTLEKANPPPALNEVFADVNSAEQDAKKEVQNAEAYRNEELPKATANAEQLRQQADAYKARTLAQANGEVARFAKLLPQYEAAPRVTRDRLYIETLEQILSNSTKVMVDVDGGNNMMYLPLDQIMKKKKEQ